MVWRTSGPSKSTTWPPPNSWLERDKDFEFLRALLDAGLCNFPILLARFETFRGGVFANALPDRLNKLAHRLRD